MTAVLGEDLWWRLKQRRVLAKGIFKLDVIQTDLIERIFHVVSDVVLTPCPHQIKNPVKVL